MEQKTREHTAFIENRRTAKLTGVDEVISSDGSTVAAVTDKAVVVVRGEKLLINSFDVKNGTLELAGDIASIEYAEKREKKDKGLLSRLLR